MQVFFEMRAQSVRPMSPIRPIGPVSPVRPIRPVRPMRPINLTNPQSTKTRISISLIDMKIVVIDGQGGSIGRAIVEKFTAKGLGDSLTCIGTNSTATANMLKGGAKQGATGENPVKVACRDADYIVGPIGIVMADSMLGEITPGMANAVGASRAHKILIPVNKCVTVAGVKDMSLNEYIDKAIACLT